MNKFDLFRAVGGVDDKYILECESLEGKVVKNKSNLVKALGIAASLIIVCGVVLFLPKILIGDRPHVDTTDDSGGPSVSHAEFPSEEEIMAEYEKADTFALWYRKSSASAMVDFNAPHKSVTIDGMTYYEVDRYDSYDAFKNSMLEVFSEKMVAKFEEETCLVNYEGKLYSLMGDGSDIVYLGGEKYEIVAESENKLILKVSVELRDEYLNGWLDDGIYPFTDYSVIDRLVFDFPYEKIGDNWVFTDFPNFCSDYDDVIKEKYTEYESDKGTLVLPSRYDGTAVVDAIGADSPFSKDSSMMFLIYYSNDKELGYASGDYVLSVKRMTEEEFKMDMALSYIKGYRVIGYDDNYYYTLSTINLVGGELPDELSLFIKECQRAILTYMPLENGWKYYEKLDEYSVEDTEASIPTDAEVLAEYETASRYADWFRLSTSSIMVNPQPPLKSAIIDNMQYFLIDRFESYKDFENALLAVFSAEVTEAFLSLPYFIEHEGMLYGVMADAGSNILLGGIKGYEVVRESDSKMVLKVSIELKDFYINGNGLGDILYTHSRGTVIDTLVFDFPYERVGNNWVFTDFPDMDNEYAEVIEKMYTEYESDKGTLVLPSRYDGTAVVKYFDKPVGDFAVEFVEGEPESAKELYTDENLMFLIYLSNPAEASASSFGDPVIEIRRAPRNGIDNIQDHVWHLPNNMEFIGYDDEFLYSMTIVADETADKAMKDEVGSFLSECRRAILTYMPLENGWNYFGELDFSDAHRFHPLSEQIIRYTFDLTPSDVITEDMLNAITELRLYPIDSGAEISTVEGYEYVDFEVNPDGYENITHYDLNGDENSPNFITRVGRRYFESVLNKAHLKESDMGDIAAYIEKLDRYYSIKDSMYTFDENATEREIDSLMKLFHSFGVYGANLVDLLSIKEELYADFPNLGKIDMGALGVKSAVRAR